MKYFKSFSLIFILVVSLFTISPNSSDAHSYPLCNPGSESQGYLVNCGPPRGHAGTSVIKFYFDSYLTQQYRTYTMSGLQRWNQTGVVSINVTTTSYTRNLVTSRYDPNNAAIASVSSVELDPYDDNHLIRWIMTYNTFRMAYRSDADNIVTAAHEFGHTIGLDDLGQASNKNKLMFGYNGITATKPTPEDIKGAKEAIK